MQAQEHWENVYTTKSSDAVSWYQEHAERSHRLIRETGVPLSGAIIDIGGGASILVDDLLTSGYKNITVLDISQTALATAQNRLGSLSEFVNWVEADITNAQLPPCKFDVWHDRAVFHFLTSSEERQAYVQAVQHAVKPGGHVIVATFAEDGPLQCSGLTVARYNAEGLHAEFGEAFTLIKHEKETHQTPFGTSQQFIYCYCLKVVS